MSGVDERVETVRQALHVLYAYTSDAANPPGAGRSQTHADGRAALDSLAAAVAGLEQRADEVLAYCDNCDRYGGFPSTNTLRDMLAAAAVVSAEPTEEQG